MPYIQPFWDPFWSPKAGAFAEVPSKIPSIGEYSQYIFQETNIVGTFKNGKMNFPNSGILAPRHFRRMIFYNFQMHAAKSDKQMSRNWSEVAFAIAGYSPEDQHKT